MDYDQTALMYQNISQSKQFEETPEYYCHLGEQKWIDKVKSKRSGDYYQAEELLNRELVPKNWQPPHVDSKGKPLRYPVKQTNSIIRKRLADGTEWLLSRQQWWGLDQAGNPINQTMDDKECFDDILPIYKLKPKDPKQRDSEMIRELDHIEHRIKYTEPFKAETVQKLYDTRDGRCVLVLKDEAGGASSPIEVKSLEDFKNRPFDELWEYLMTPRQKIEPTTAKENLKQYG
jgi:hypothetical protein